MLDFMEHIKDRIQGRADKGERRALEWRRIRKEHLKLFNECYVCRKKTKLQVHHIIPFNIAPDLELNPDNLITLCTNKPVNCHILYGHLGNYQDTNMTCVDDAVYWRRKLR